MTAEEKLKIFNLLKTAAASENYGIVPQNFATTPDFSDDEIDNYLLCQEYGSSYGYWILSLIYPDRDWKDSVYHEDHIYPRATFTSTKLRKIGLTDEQIEFLLANFNTIVNLELLTAFENSEKNAKPFEEWIKTRDPKFKERHCIPNVEYTYDKFEIFIKRRKEILHEKLKNILTL